MHCGKGLLLVFFGFGGVVRLGVRFEVVGYPPFTFEFGNKGWNVGLCQVAIVIEVLSPTIGGEERLGCITQLHPFSNAFA